MLDTNIVSHFVKQHKEVIRRAVAIPMESLCISVITEGELLFGLARRPDTTSLNFGIRQFLSRVDVLPWDRAVTADYARLRARAQGIGKNIASLDMLIAAHAFTVGATLVTNDAAFNRISGLATEDWTRPLVT
jgi:tRNA(fMet)-specific endonuclease VapC